MSDDNNAMEEMLWLDPEAPQPSAREQREAMVYALLSGTFRGLDLAKRLPNLMRSRGWPAEDDDLRSVLAGAVACKKIGAGATIFRRPVGAEQLGGKWPAFLERMSASQVVEWLDLQELLEQA